MRKTSYLLCVVAGLTLLSPTMAMADCVTDCVGAPIINVSTLGTAFEETYSDAACTACTDDINAGCMGNYDEGFDSFYHVVNDTALDQYVQVYVNLFSTYSGVAIFTDCADPSTCLISDTNGAARIVDTYICLAPSEEIYIQIDTWPSPACADYYIGIQSTTPCPPTNDTCADAEANPALFEITGDGSWSGTTNAAWANDDYNGAGGTTASCALGGDSVGPDAVYYFDITNGSGSIDLEMDPATGFDNVLWVITDCANPATSVVDCVDDAMSGNPESLSLSGLADGRYY
ncbi:MAG: hypothetical protein K8R59_00870, partial [Thermoanaerobaculales bacterium]|nr:hypothetical protein [Thermoanaerobaculales bacterium]